MAGKGAQSVCVAGARYPRLCHTHRLITSVRTGVGQGDNKLAMIERPTRPEMLAESFERAHILAETVGRYVNEHGHFSTPRGRPMGDKRIFRCGHARASRTLDQANALVGLIPNGHMLRDIFADVAGDRFGIGSHRQQLGAAETEFLCCRSPKRPFATKGGRGARVIVALNVLESKAGADIGANINDQVIVNAAVFLTLEDAYPIAISRADHVIAQGSKTTLGFLRISHVIAKGEGQKTEPFYTVFFGHRLNVPSQCGRGFAMLCGERFKITLGAVVTK